MRLRRPLAIHRLRWSLSATWIGTTTWLPGTAQRPSRRENPLPAGRMITCVYWWRRSYPGQKKTWPVLRHGEESLGIRWRGYLPCTPSTRRMCSHGWGTCPAPCGFQVSRNTSFPMSRSAGQTASISHWGTGRPRPAIQF